jgi:hypothetical protein
MDSRSMAQISRTMAQISRTMAQISKVVVSPRCRMKFISNNSDAKDSSWMQKLIRRKERGQ